MHAGLNNLGDYDAFSGVAAASAASVWAAGGNFSQYAFPMVGHWAGRRWMQDGVPAPGGDFGDSWLNAVAAPSPKEAWAVGAVIPQQTIKTLILAWNDHGWRQVRSPSPAHSNDSELLAVAAQSARDAWAVGYAHAKQGQSVAVSRSAAFAVGQANYPHHVIKLVIERWTGSRWELVAVPNPPDRKGAGNI